MVYYIYILYLPTLGLFVWQMQVKHTIDTCFGIPQHISTFKAFITHGHTFRGTVMRGFSSTITCLVKAEEWQKALSFLVAHSGVLSCVAFGYTWAVDEFGCW